MGAKNKVVDGDYKGKNVILTAQGITIVTGFLKSIMIDENTIKSYEIFDSEKKTSATSAIGRGAVGSLFLGPIGLLAAASAKKKGVYAVAVEFKDGKRSLLEVNEKIYKKMLLLRFNDTNSINEETLNSNIDIPEQIKKLAELRNDGILTEEEFNNKKAELLTRI